MVNNFYLEEKWRESLPMALVAKMRQELKCKLSHPPASSEHLKDVVQGAIMARNRPRGSQYNSQNENAALIAPTPGFPMTNPLVSMIQGGCLTSPFEGKLTHSHRDLT
jgi:hypothetical protein